jgi:general secretion pathway protein J
MSTNIAPGRHREAGFTLLEMVVALVLLATMLGLLFGGLRLGIRAWESGTTRGDRADQLLLTFSFVRKELTAAFPWRFKDPLSVKLAFKGERDRLRFVSMRPAEIGGGGLAFVSLEFDGARGAGTAGRLVMRRTLAATDAKDFEALDSAEGFTLAEGITAAQFDYFGAENDTNKPDWSDRWDFPQRLPSHVRLRLKLGEEALPDLVVALKLGEEAGCYESSFQRVCVPRR